MCSTYCQPGILNYGLYWFDVLNLLVPSILRSDQWLQCYRHRHPQFLEFGTLRPGYSPLVIHSQHHHLGTGDSVLGLFDTLNLLVPSVLLSDQWFQCCRHKHSQFSEFEILRQIYSPPLMCSTYCQPGILNYGLASLLKSSYLGFLVCRVLLISQIQF